MTTDQPTFHFHAGSNDPGYLPDSSPACFPTYVEAKSWMLAELNLDADNASSWADPHECDDIPCPVYGDDCPASKGDALSATAEDLNLHNGPEWAETTAGRAYWITAVRNDDCDEAEPEPEPAFPDLAAMEANALARKPRPAAPKMTRAHFTFLADLIANLWPDDETTNTEYVAECFADALADTSPRFARDRFIVAATS